MSDAHSSVGSSVSAGISNSAVRILRDYTGRGPTRARTTVNRDTVMILFGDILTTGERKLTELGDGAAVLQMRHRYQQAMREELSSMVEAHLNRKVVAFMSANHLDPDLGVEVFVLDPLPDGDHADEASSGHPESHDGSVDGHEQGN